jgi:DNA helicase-2/ATP-dependent DNA helicase PcrA
MDIMKRHMTEKSTKGHPLNERQKEAVSHPDTPLLIVAGAGTGKTRALTHRIASIITAGTKPERICALTFTNKAAREMEERVFELVGSAIPRQKRDIFGAPGPFLGTFHSFGARMLRYDAKAFGRSAAFSIFDDTDSFQVIRKTLKQEFLDRTNEGAGFFAERITQLKNGMISREELTQSRNPDDRLALEFFDRYERTLRAQNAFDFDDLIDKTAALLRIDAPRRAAYQRRFTHVFVDEYQDLNNRQYELVRQLAGDGGRVSVVGDDQQTIYSWRGSNLDIFLNFSRDWPQSAQVVLDQNYRSTGNIIRAASTLIGKNTKQQKKDLWTENPDGELITLHEAEDEEDEAAWVAEEIEKRRSTDRGGTTAILYRTNAQSRPIEQMLIEYGIPYRVYGGLRFYERKEIKDIVAGLRFAANERDLVSYERLEKNLSKGRLRAFLGALAEADERTPAALVKLFIVSTDYLEYARKNLSNFVDRQENIAELLRFAEEYADLPTFLERASLVQATDDAAGAEAESATKSAPVTLMTMHLAKGLEFDRVFVVGCTEGLLPHARATASLGELEEERRLLYVAMTRAKKKLFLSFFDIPSRFLAEIPPEHLHFEGAGGAEEGAHFSDDEERYITID